MRQLAYKLSHLQQRRTSLKGRRNGARLRIFKFQNAINAEVRKGWMEW